MTETTLVGIEIPGRYQVCNVMGFRQENIGRLCFCNVTGNADVNHLQVTSMKIARVQNVPDLGKGKGGCGIGLDGHPAYGTGIRIDSRRDVHTENRFARIVD